MTGGPDRPLYIGPEPAFAMFHPARRAAARDAAILICPPFGWDDVCSYRSVREWAQWLAARGYPTLRLSYPSTGDSGGAPRDPDRLGAWTVAVRDAAGWIRTATGINRVVAIGIELGGLLAYRAAAAGAPIDDLALWATPSKGRAVVRQLNAFARLELVQFFEGLEPPPPPPAGELEAGGFVLSEETARSLSDLDLATLELADAGRRRVLLLDRDGIAVDDRLRARLEQLGASVTIRSGPGYAAMTSHPQQAVAPTTVIEAVGAWVAGAGDARVPPADRPTGPVAAETAVVCVDGAEIEERPLWIEQSFGRLSAVLTTAAGGGPSDVGVLLLNAGAVRRIGPNRMWVEAARRWAAWGVSTVRLDVEGIGEADGDGRPYVADAGLYVPTLVPQVRTALDALSEQGIGSRFVVGGLCAGAYWSFHAALQDPRVIAAMMVNPRALIWDPALSPARDFRALRTGKATWKNLREQVTAQRVAALARWVAGAPGRKLAEARAGRGQVDELADALARVRTERKQMLFLFSENEPLRDELQSSGALSELEQLEHVTLEYLPVRDHTLRPSHAQRLAHAALDRALVRALRPGVTPVAEASPPGGEAAVQELDRNL